MKRTLILTKEDILHMLHVFDESDPIGKVEASLVDMCVIHPDKDTLVEVNTITLVREY